AMDRRRLDVLRHGATRDVSDLIDTTEMYLRTIYELVEDGVTPLRARIAEQLEHSGPTVSQTVARMERDGLVVVSQDRHLELTEEGQLRALRVMRKHRLAERMLVDVVGLDLPDVHEEACRWEHVMSDRVERRLVSMITAPYVSPYGNPIPGLDELGVDVEKGSAEPVATLHHAVSAGVTTAVVGRIGEAPQTLPGFLDDVTSLGLLPGASVKIAADGEDFAMATDLGTLSVGMDVARHIFVTPM
ncbi:MAG: metal-dependent transcriptional regulator, partial [Demequina sp.]